MSDILTIQDLHVDFNVGNNKIPIIRGIDLSIEKGKILSLVGESGCGKTMTAMSILQLLPPIAKIKSGKILFNNQNLLDLTEKEMQKIRGKEISLIFQEPGLALNPVYTIGNQIGEVLKIHRKEITDIKEETIKLLNLVKIPNPENKIRAYPHQLSGGMQQRALIAMAIACNPKLLIADEPTTALDVTVQAQILMLIKELISKLDMSVLLITHDLGIVAETADNVAVMYAGKIIEYTDVHTIFKNPLHPYTKGLLESIPRIEKKQKKLSAIKGNVPDIAHIPNGCSFNPRCNIATEQCKIKTPALREISKSHWVECDII
jgi:oligopeptide/dipeptide ABC transporter ATP-binding protein